MSSFTGDIIIRKIGVRLWEVFVPFSYYVGKKSDKDIIVVPKGTVTDFASIPRIFWVILPQDGRYTAAAILHDYLYSNHSRTRKASDKIFYEAMGVLGVSTWKRFILYQAVRKFGWIAWIAGRRVKV